MTQDNRPRRAAAAGTARHGAPRPTAQPRHGAPVEQPSGQSRQARRAARTGSAPQPMQGRSAQGRPVQEQPRRVQRDPAQVKPEKKAAPKQADIRLRRWPKDLWLVILVGIAACIVAFFAQVKWPDGFVIEQKKKTTTTEDTKTVVEIHGDGPIRINELMSANTSGLIDEEGKTPDWIEIINIGSKSVDLSGYKLAKSEKSTNVFEFPNVVLEPGKTVIVFASSTLRNEAGAEYHAPFRLSSAGGTLMLFGPAGTAIDSVNYPALRSDTSYARQDRYTWAVCEQPTPSFANDDENAIAQMIAESEGGVEITEIVASNTQYAPDENGLFQDYIELHNVTDQVKDLSGWYLTDDPDRPKRWQLPEGYTLQPGEYRIIYASGLDKADTNPPHARFGLSSEGETVVLSDSRGNLVDSVSYDLLEKDTAWKKQADGSWAQGTPTPATGD